MRKLVLFAIILAFCASCGICKHQPTIEYRDSIRVEYRDRIIHDTTSFEIPVEVERIVTRDTASHLENTYGKSDAVVSEGFLFHSLMTKPQVIKVPFAVEVHDTTYIEHETNTEFVTQYVEKDLTWWQDFRIKAFWWLLLIIILTNIKTINKLFGL